jgi:hypothetical protein
VSFNDCKRIERSSSDDEDNVRSNSYKKLFELVVSSILSFSSSVFEFIRARGSSLVDVIVSILDLLFK